MQVLPAVVPGAPAGAELMEPAQAELAASRRPGVQLNRTPGLADEPSLSPKQISPSAQLGWYRGQAV